MRYSFYAQVRSSHYHAPHISSTPYIVGHLNKNLGGSIYDNASKKCSDDIPEDEVCDSHIDLICLSVTLTLIINLCSSLVVVKGSDTGLLKLHTAVVLTSRPVCHNI